MKDGALDHCLCDRLLEDYIPDDEVVVFADPRHALQCKRIDAPNYIDHFMKRGYVKIANLSFSSKVIIASIGVRQGFRKERRLHLSIKNVCFGSIADVHDRSQTSECGGGVRRQSTCRRPSI